MNKLHDRPDIVPGSPSKAPSAECPARQGAEARLAGGVRNAGYEGARLGASEFVWQTRPRDRVGAAQERAGEVLRRGRDAQAHAAGEAAGGQAAHEASGNVDIPQEAFMSLLRIGK